MLFFYINSSDRTSDVVGNTLRINNQIQQRSDSCQFKVWHGTKPTENQDLQVFDGATISTQVGATIVLQDSYQTDINQFYAGQAIWLKIGDASVEKAEVLTYTESTRTIVLVAAPSVSLSAGDKVGELIFGGVVARVADMNLHSLTNIEYMITGVDYTKIFDKKVISDTWENVDSRYIINDFVNTTVNYNSTLDNLSYANNGAIQAEWNESNDGNNPTVDTSDFLEGTSSGVFSWTHTGTGNAHWAGSPTSKNLSALLGVNSGTPTKGNLMGWFKTSDYSKITSLKIRVGSSASDYAELTIVLQNTTDWQYVSTKFTSVAITGTPDWTATDYSDLGIVETSSGSIKWNGLRVNANNSFTLFNVESTNVFDDLRSPQLKPTALINQITKTWEYVWYIDYERDIHFRYKENDPAPYDIDETSNNFVNLKIEVDTSNIGNRVIIRGGEITSSSIYAQVFQGNSVLRTWLMKNKFNNLAILIDNNTSTDTCEAGTNITNIKATTHGLTTGDHIVNRTRSVVREITVVDVDNFTVEAVPSQTNGDTFSKFSVSKTIGIEGLVDESTVDYVYNSNEKSVRASSQTATLTSTEYVRFAYNERLQIQIQYTDSASANGLKALGLGDGIFDLDPVTDRNIRDITTAITLAQAKVAEFSNPIITGNFSTDQKGLKAGQILHIVDSNRSLDDNFVIQTVSKKQKEGRFKDFFEIDVTFGTTLFGWIEFMQKLLKTKDNIELNVDEIVETFATSDEIVETSETSSAIKGGFKTASEAEIATTDDSNNTYINTGWKWEVSTGQTVTTRWSLFEWG